MVLWNLWFVDYLWVRSYCITTIALSPLKSFLHRTGFQFLDIGEKTVRKRSYEHLRRLMVLSGIVQLGQISPDRRETYTDTVASTCFQFGKGFGLMIWEFWSNFCLLHSSKYICLWSVYHWITSTCTSCLDHSIYWKK